MKLKKYICLLGIATMALTTACEDQSELITSVNYDRLFAPINLEARVVNQINVRLTWTPVNGAQSYDLEIYQNANQTSEDEEENDSKVLTYDGTPVRTITGITNSEIPYTVTKLESETKFTARILARGENITESKWSGIEFKTNAEQIFKEIVPDELEAKQVTLHWTIGEVADKIVLTPGNIEHKVTSDEIAAGAATITDLTPETAYTAKLLRADGKTRGTISFETLIDLGGAIPVYPEDDFAAIISNAEDGAVLAFFPGTYQMANDENGKVGKITLAKSIEIKAVRPNERPIINGCFQITGGASAISMKQIILDGKDTDGSQAFDYKDATAFKGLTLDDCEVMNYVKGVYYVNVAATIDEININNCLFHNIECNGGDMFDCRSGAIKTIKLTNTTIWESCLERDLIRYDDKSSNFAGIAPVITIDHCTFNGVCNSSSKRILYVRFKGNSITFTNNMVTNTAGNFSNQDKTAIPAFKNNNYFKADGYCVAGGSGKFTDGSGTLLDPGYKDATKGDFTLSNEDLIYKKVGDPRWY